MFQCIEEITLHKAMKLVSSVLPCYHCAKSVTNGHFVSRDLFIYYLTQTGMTGKMVVTKR